MSATTDTVRPANWPHQRLAAALADRRLGTTVHPADDRLIRFAPAVGDVTKDVVDHLCLESFEDGRNVAVQLERERCRQWLRDGPDLKLDDLQTDELRDATWSLGIVRVLIGRCQALIETPDDLRGAWWSDDLAAAKAIMHLRDSRDAIMELTASMESLVAVRANADERAAAYFDDDEHAGQLEPKLQLVVDLLTSAAGQPMTLSELVAAARRHSAPVVRSREAIDRALTDLVMRGDVKRLPGRGGFALAAPR